MTVTKNILHMEFPSSYLYRMATNHCLNWIRDRKYHDDSDIDDLISFIASSDVTDEVTTFNSILEKIFNGHPESTRVIATLHLYDGYTLEEVSEMVNMSLSGVRKRLRSLKESALKKGLQNE
jgi:RNA polymerase sigma-70 factor (ECF subfamily)